MSAIPLKSFFIGQAALQMHDAHWWRGFYSTAKLPGMAAILDRTITVAELRGRYWGIMDREFAADQVALENA